MRSKTAATVAVAALLLVSCGPTEDGDEDTNGYYSDDEDEGGDEANATPAGDTEAVTVEGDFEPYGEDVTAVTYDEGLVPTGGEVEVNITPEENGTRFELDVDGLEPDYEFGAHLHTDPCGSHPEDSGPHYQDELDPEQPSTDPAYANPENEVWLDFTTDEDGDAESETQVEWLVRPGEAASIVIHEEHTSHEPGSAGQAGDRLACVNVPL